MFNYTDTPSGRYYYRFNNYTGSWEKIAFYSWKEIEECLLTSV